MKSGVPCRSGSVSETIRATYTAGTCRLTRAISPISFSLMQLRPYFRVRRAYRGNRRWTGATPPFCLPDRHRRAALFSHATSPGRVAPVPSIPGGKAIKVPKKTALGTVKPGGGETAKDGSMIHRVVRQQNRTVLTEVSSRDRASGKPFVKRSFSETSYRRRWRHQILGLNWRNGPAWELAAADGKHGGSYVVFQLGRCPRPSQAQQNASRAVLWRNL